MSRERQYKTPKLGYIPKAERVKREEKARRLRAKALSAKEKLAYETIREYGIAQMQAIGHGTTVDETEYAKALIRRLDELA